MMVRAFLCLSEKQKSLHYFIKSDNISKVILKMMNFENKKEEFMEIELKYRIPDEETAEQIWIDKSFFHMEEEGSREELCFDAKYFDTADGALNDKEIAYRVRKEGQRWVATVKWSGFSEGELHQREELNIPVSSDQPDLSVFSESEIGETINKLTEGKELECILQTKFVRRQEYIY